MTRSFTIEAAYKQFFEQLGVDSELVLKKAGISPMRFKESGLKVSREEYIALMQSIDHVMTDDQLIIAGDVEEFVMFSPPLFAGMCAKNGEECYKRISAYKKLIGPFRVDVSIDDKALHLDFVFDEGQTKIPRVTLLSEQILLLGLLRKGTGIKVNPLSITSEYTYDHPTILNYFGTTPVKGSVNRMSFSLADVQEPFLTKNNVMWHYLEPELQKRIQDIEVDDSYVNKVKTALYELIPAGSDQIEAVADILALSPRTLQRKLSSENTTYLKLLNQTREIMARHYLKDAGISNDDVAFLIGYSDANAFNRAFRKWTGITVGAFRKQYI